jgi:hypothetical protein
MSYAEAKQKVEAVKEAGGGPLRDALMIALDKMPTDEDGSWQEEVMSLFTGVPSSMFWEIDGKDGGPGYSLPPIRGDVSICRPPADWLHKLRIVRNSRRDLFDVLKRGA